MAEKNFPEHAEEFYKLKEMNDCAYKKVGPNEIKTGGFCSKYVPKKRAPSTKNDAYYSNSHIYLEYLWKTVADLIIYCKLPSENMINQSYNFILSDVEIVFLKILKNKLLLNIWESAFNMRTSRSIAKIYAHIAKEDEEFRGFLIKFYCGKIFSISNEYTINYLLKGLWSLIDTQENMNKLVVIFR